MEDLSLHVMDIVENSIRSGASEVAVILIESSGADGQRWLVLTIDDDGKGMSDEEIARSLDPFYTSKEGKRVGLGLPLFRQSAVESGGSLIVESKPGAGTRVKAEFGLDHPDMKPLGDMEETVKLLRMFHPEVRFSFEYRKSSSQGG